MLPAAYKAVREFGDLNIYYASNDTPNKIPDIVLNPEEITDDGTADSWIELEWHFNDYLFPIGAYYGSGNRCEISIGIHGKIYLLSLIDGSCWVMGHSIEQALENLIGGSSVERYKLPGFSESQEAKQVASAFTRATR